MVDDFEYPSQSMSQSSIASRASTETAVSSRSRLQSTASSEEDHPPESACTRAMPDTSRDPSRNWLTTTAPPPFSRKGLKGVVLPVKASSRPSSNKPDHRDLHSRRPLSDEGGLSLGRANAAEPVQSSRASRAERRESRWASGMSHPIQGEDYMSGDEDMREQEVSRVLENRDHDDESFQNTVMLPVLKSNEVGQDMEDKKGMLRRRWKSLGRRL